MRKVLFFIAITITSISNAQSENTLSAVNTTCTTSMADLDFKNAIAELEKHDFDEAKKEAAEAIIANNCLTSLQVKAIVDLFAFEEDKLDFAKKALAKTTDPQNYKVVIDSLDFEASKKELRALLK